MTPWWRSPRSSASQWQRIVAAQRDRRARPAGRRPDTAHPCPTPAGDRRHARLGPAGPGLSTGADRREAGGDDHVHDRLSRRKCLCGSFAHRVGRRRSHHGLSHCARRRAGHLHGHGCRRHGHDGQRELHSHARGAPAVSAAGTVTTFVSMLVDPCPEPAAPIWWSRRQFGASLPTCRVSRSRTCPMRSTRPCAACRRRRDVAAGVSPRSSRRRGAYPDARRGPRSSGGRAGGSVSMRAAAKAVRAERDAR